MEERILVHTELKDKTKLISSIMRVTTQTKQFEEKQ